MSDKPIIKLHRNKNRYVFSKSGIWVRDLTGAARPEDINRLIESSDYELLCDNELVNTSMHLASIHSTPIYAPKVLIVSDGHGFDERQKLLSQLPSDVVVIGTNRSLPKWQGVRKMDWYVANNPYQECMACLPSHNYYPNCIASIRTNPEFIKQYRHSRAAMYCYSPTEDSHFSSRFSDPVGTMDDYRNPICAALSLANKWGVQRLALSCCDDAFEGTRPGATQLPNGLWMYPQHKVSHGIIDGMLYWLTSKKYRAIVVGNHSSGPEYQNAPYIQDAELKRFFA